MLTSSQAVSVPSFAPVIGKPYEGKLHVRFDEGALETEHGGTRRHRAIERARNRSRSPKPPRQCSTLQERNALKYLPWRFHGEFRRRWKMIHGMKEYADAKNQLSALIAWLSTINLEAVRSIEEAEGETLTLIQLGAPMKLRSTLLSTNPIESAFNGVRSRTKRVKHWRKGQDQIARWAAATLDDMEKRFRLIPAYREIPMLIDALRRKDLIEVEQIA